MGASGRAAVAVVAVLALLAGALGGSGVATAADPAGFALRPGVTQLAVLEATPGQNLQLLDGGDADVGTVDAPGGARPLWAFDTIDHGERVTIATDKAHRSRLVLPVVPDVHVPRSAPHCSSLRSQPCRTYPGS